MKHTVGGRYRAKIPEELFQPIALRDKDTLESSIAILEEHILNVAVDRELLLRDLLEASPSLLGFTLSALSDATAALVADYMYATFPTEASKYETSLALSVLRNLVRYFGTVNYLSDKLLDRQQAIRLAEAVISAVSTLDLPADDLNDHRAAGKHGDGRLRRPFQHESRNTARPGGLLTVSIANFTALGKSIPKTQAEATDLCQEILHGQREILRRFFETLRRPDAKEIFMTAYIPQHPVAENVRITSISTPATLDTSSDLSREIAASPTVMPLKAALYFDSADGFGAWTLWMSQKACSDLRSAKRRDAKMFGIFLNKIKDLSHGHFSKDNQKYLAGMESDIPIFEAKMTRDTRLIYQVDCLLDFNSEMETQVLRIFGIYTHAEINRVLWESVGRHNANGNREHRGRCVFRSLLSDSDNDILPATFPAQKVSSVQKVSTIQRVSSAQQDALIFPELSQELQEQLHAIINVQHYFNFDQALMDSIEADRDTTHVFNLPFDQQTIVKYEGSCYVIGRSGTGKTTTSLLKMYGKEQSWKLSSANPYKNMPRPRQVFVTRSRILSEKVKESYEDLLRSQEATSNELDNSSVARNRPLAEILDLDEDDLWQTDLPKRFTLLEDKHFPLFLSSDRLLTLLEADGISETGVMEFYAQTPDDLTEVDVFSREFLGRRRYHFVTFETFMHAYWPHMPRRLTAWLDPALVFSEIIGVIKGSKETWNEISGHLSRETYVKMSIRTHPTFAHTREEVYDLFEAYTRIRRSRRDYDTADRSHAVMQFLRTTDIVLPVIHYLYVDEVQDNSMIDALIFRLICRNPNGLFWGGDTAQMISEGSSFRFNDLKAFMHDVEDKLPGNRITAFPPKVFQLTRSYRSHAGIANCAQTVIKMITKFWRSSIDTLEEEQGVVDGQKLMLFTNLDLGDLPFKQSQFGTTNNQINFGADQCILVRDEAGLERLQSKIGKIGTVLTLYDCKGMEFDDVLIYNFFADSPCSKSQWRALLNYLPETLGIKCPPFNESTHMSLSLELRFLYVAITRARRRVWIVDCSEKIDIMKTIWATHDQININPPVSSLSVTASTADEWLERANKLFNNKNYMQAMNAYENAQDWRLRNIAEAYHHRHTAMRQTDVLERARLYIVAAHAFEKSAEEVSDEAKTQAQLFRLSGECYERAGRNKLAAEAYERAEEYALSASHYRTAGEFDDAVRIVQAFEVDSGTAQGILDIAKLYYVSNGDYRKAFSLLDDESEALQFLDDYATNEAKIEFLKTRAQYIEAAAIYAADGLLLQATKTCLMDQPSASRERQAADYLLEAFWSMFTLGVAANATHGGSEEHFKLAKGLDVLALEEEQRNHLDLFWTIHGGDNTRLREAGRSYFTKGHLSAFLLCFDRHFDTRLDFNALPLPEIMTELSDFLLYAETLQKLGGEEKPLENTHIRRLLAFKESASGDDRYFIPGGSLLYSEALSYGHQASNDGFEFSAPDLTDFVRHVLNARLRNRITELQLSSRIQSSRVCLGSCTTNCTRLHVNDTRTYTMRVEVELLKIRIYHTIWGIESYQQRRTPHRDLLMHLYEAIMPPHSRLGSYSNIDATKISEKAKRVLLQWICESIYALKIGKHDPEPHKFFLTLTFQLFFLYQWATDCVTTPPYLRTVPWATTTEEPTWLIQVIPAVLGFTAVQGPLALSRAQSLICYIIEKKVTIDVTVLNDILDRICALSTIAHVLQTRRSDETVTLLRSWAQVAVGVGAERLQSQQIGSSLQLVQSTKYLLEKIISGPDADIAHILYGDRPCRSQKGTVLQTFVGRLCQVLVILGFNSLDVSIKRSCFSTIQKAANGRSTIDIRYKTATTLKGMITVIRDRLLPPSLDNLVTIYRERISAQSTVPGVKHMKITDLFPAANAGASRSPLAQLGRAASRRHATIRSSKRSSVQMGLAVPYIDDEQHCDEAMAEPHVLQMSSAKPNTVLDYADTGVKTSAASTDDSPVPDEADTNETSLFSPEELAAAHTIWDLYQKHRQSQRPVNNSMDMLRSRVYITCLKASTQMSQRRYRHLYLGVFPHLYACLQSLHAHVGEEAKVAKKRATTVPHTQLEEVKVEMDQTSAIVKTVARLLETLHPSSEFHTMENVHDLRALTREVYELTVQVPKAISGEWEADMRLVLKAMMPVDLEATVSKKPRLVVDDVYPGF